MFRRLQYEDSQIEYEKATEYAFGRFFYEKKGKSRSETLFPVL